MVIMLPVEKKCGYICIVLQIFKIPELTPPLKSHSIIHGVLENLSAARARGGGRGERYICVCLSSD